MSETKLPAVIRKALRGQTPDVVRDTIKTWTEGDAGVRRDILDFFESDGPRMKHQSQLKHEEGTPTSADLTQWLK